MSYDIDDEDFTPYCVTKGGHSPVAGMMVVHSEDLEYVATMRAENDLPPITCDDCDDVYRAGDGWVKS